LVLSVLEATGVVVGLLELGDHTLLFTGKHRVKLEHLSFGSQRILSTFPTSALLDKFLFYVH